MGGKQKNEPDSQEAAATSSKPPLFSLFAFKDVYKSTGGFADKARCGRWLLGTMHRATLKDGTPVVVKCGFDGPRHYAAQVALTNELKFLTRLDCDKYLSRLVGFSDDHPEGDKLLLLDVPARGTLYDVLHAGDPMAPPLALPLRVHLAIGVARCLRFLHYRCKVAHRDIRSSSIWVDKNWDVRVANFAFAMDIPKNRVAMPESPIGTLPGLLETGYPEVGYLAAKTDVFCYGILLFEILSNKRVFDVGEVPGDLLAWGLSLVRKNHVLHILDPRVRLLPNEVKVPRDMSRIAAACVQPDACSRPTMSAVVESLRYLSAEFPFRH